MVRPWLSPAAGSDQAESVTIIGPLWSTFRVHPAELCRNDAVTTRLGRERTERWSNPSYKKDNRTAFCYRENVRLTYQQQCKTVRHDGDVI